MPPQAVTVHSEYSYARTGQNSYHKMQIDLFAAFSNTFCHPCREENLSGCCQAKLDSSESSDVSRPELVSQHTGLAAALAYRIEGNPKKTCDERSRKLRRRHASLIDDNGAIISAPMPGWTSEQFTALILALREIPTKPTHDGKAETAYWARMRLVAARVPGKSAGQCSECARYITDGGIGVFADIRKKQP
jgi:hypothetical protein